MKLSLVYTQKNCNSDLSDIDGLIMQRSHNDWPVEIFKENNTIWVSDLLWVSPEELKDSEHDMSVLNISLSSSLKEVSEAFVKTKVFRWLYDRLRDSEVGELYFGSLTATLHNQLCDDPIPYRKNVKGLLSTLLSYCDVYAAHLIKIDRPRYSQRVSLVR